MRQDEVRKRISSSPRTSCSLGPIRTSILKLCLDQLTPVLTLSSSNSNSCSNNSSRSIIIIIILFHPYLDISQLVQRTINKLKHYLPLHIMRMFSLYFCKFPSQLWYLSLGIWSTVTKFNSHTELLFKATDLLKLKEMFNFSTTYICVTIYPLISTYFK